MEKPTHQVFNPQQAPLFLGIFAENVNDTKQTMLQSCEMALKNFAAEFPNDDKLNNDWQNVNKTFKFPQSHHITSLYCGGKKMPDNPCYSTFQEGLKQKIEIRAIAYVPEKIICGACFPEQSQIQIANKCPHITMLVQKWQPVKSNAVLEALFISKGAPFSQEFEDMKAGKQVKPLIKRVEVDVEGEGTQTVYFCILSQVISIPAVTKGHFAQGKKK